ncbi:MAG TPA: Gfo/Idh/MocA family oxidoreductase, partial [Trueperaceae bacterium]|nr:Gfo/Idh/MocA family oxidoreductase [Trueperaceae bacterium]
MKKLRYGMIGGGIDAFIGEVHRKAMALDAQFEFIAGALSSTPEKSLRSGQELSLARNYASWQEMLKSEQALSKEERIDFVVIVTPNHLHFPIAKAFASAGFNIVCDKPLVHTSQQANELKDIFQEKDIVFMLTHNYTGYPMVKQARHMVKAGQLGKIRKIVVEYNQGWLANNLAASGQKQASWRADPAKSGIAGAMADIGSHAENLLSTISGLKIEEICAELTSFVDGRLLDDDANILLRLENNTKAVLMASQIAVGEENNLKISIFG